MNKERIVKDFKRNKWLYALALPIVAYYVVFQYFPMLGAVIAFQHYSPMKGILGSEWAGLSHFVAFFDSYYFGRLIRNTLYLSVYSLLFEFSAPIVLALFMNEIRFRFFKSLVQTVSFLPYFVSLIVVGGIIKDLTRSGGLINAAYTWLTGGSGQDMLQQPELFRTIYVLSEIWQRAGWESIIYLAALATIPIQQYEAARIDGASRWRQMISITLPGLLPTIVIMLILRVGHMLDIGYEKKYCCCTIPLFTIQQTLFPPSSIAKDCWITTGASAQLSDYLIQQSACFCFS